MSLVAVLSLLLVAAHPAEGPAARAQARLCEDLPGEEGLAACRRALELGLGSKRSSGVRELLARRLASLERWDELAEHFRSWVALQPDSAEAQLRLGSTLLFALDRPEESLSPLREAARLAPESAEARMALATALNALGRNAEAVAEFQEGLRIDASFLERRPAALAVYESARQDARWP
jgi:tetratricopeptide (TPR) repeat protein